MKNLIIVVLLLVVGFLGWQVFRLSMRGPESKVLVVAPVAIQRLALEPDVTTTKAPIAPKSEVDRKLEKLGFGTSAEVHKITVQ